MTEEQWIEAIEAIQSEASRKGLINPLDVLVRAYKRSQGHGLTFNWRVALYKLSERFKKAIYILIQSKLTLMDRAILFFPVEPTHLNQMIPVALLLKQEDVPFYFVTPRMRIFKALTSLGLPVYLLGDQKRKLVGGIKLIEFGDLEPVLSQFPTPFAEYLKRSYLEVVRLSGSLQLLLKKFQFAYVFTGNDLTWEGRLLARISAALSIRTGMIQHGLLGKEIYNRLHIVDDFYVYGNEFRNILVQDGFEESRIIVSGAPYLDSRRICVEESSYSVLKERFQLKNNFVLIALSGYGHRTSIENYRITLAWIRRLIVSHPELEFVIKLHRKENIKDYSDFPVEMQNRIIDRKKGRKFPQDIFEWFKGCSCLITGTSMVAYEAMHSHVPVISVDPLKQFFGIDFIERKAAHVVHTFEELDSALLRVNGQSGKAQVFIEEVFNKGELSAAERIFRHMDGLLNLD